MEENDIHFRLYIRAVILTFLIQKRLANDTIYMLKSLKYKG